MPMNLRQQYLEASKELRKKIKVPFQVRKDEKALESWLIDVESSIASLEFKIRDAKSSEDFKPDEILDLVDELELKNRRFKQGEILLKEMFTKDTPQMPELQEK